MLSLIKRRVRYRCGRRADRFYFNCSITKSNICRYGCRQPTQSTGYYCIVSAGSTCQHSVSIIYSDQCTKGVLYSNGKRYSIHNCYSGYRLEVGYQERVRCTHGRAIGCIGTNLCPVLIDPVDEIIAAISRGRYRHLVVLGVCPAPANDRAAR